MNDTKIQLSQEEMELVTNAGWLLTKNLIIEKVYALFGNLAAGLQEQLAGARHPFPEEVLSMPPKISRGEQYQGLPYVMLDYPRCFSREDHCAIRTFFWWGHFFSVTLQLKGKWLRHFSAPLQSRLPDLQRHDFRVCVHESEWRHDLADDNYVPIGQYLAASPAEWLAERPFLKISSGIPLQHWNEAEQQIGQLYRAVLESLG